MLDPISFVFHICPSCGYTQVLVEDELDHYCPIDSFKTQCRPARTTDEPSGRDERTDDMLL